MIYDGSYNILIENARETKFLILLTLVLNQKKETKHIISTPKQIPCISIFPISTKGFKFISFSSCSFRRCCLIFFVLFSFVS